MTENEVGELIEAVMVIRARINAELEAAAAARPNEYGNLVEARYGLSLAITNLRALVSGAPRAGEDN